jgi:hypothetical protein
LQVATFINHWWIILEHLLHLRSLLLSDWFGHGLLFMKRGKLTVSTRIASGKRTAADKMAALEVADVTVVKNPAEVGEAVQTILS